MRTIRTLALTSATGLACVLIGCGGGPECGDGTVKMDGECVPVTGDGGVSCGPGTVPMDGECVPEGDGGTGASCGEGTTEMDGECVPDGSMVCTGNTRFDADTGTCVVDEGACAEGTVYVEEEGRCVPFDDTLEGDVAEAGEPNGEQEDATWADLPVPAPDETVTFEGCVQPDDFDGDGTTDVDFDGFVFSVTAPTILDITLDGKGGLSAGFAVLPADEELASTGWQRLGLDLVSDGAQRQVYLPTAGNYVLFASDGRSLLLNEPAGGEETCYFGQVEQVEIPDPTPLEDGMATGDIGDPQFFSTTASGDGGLMFGTLSEDSSAVVSAGVTRVAGELGITASEAEDSGDTNLVAPGLSDGDEVVFVVDHVYDISLDPVEWSLSVEAADSQPMPADGSVDITHSEDSASYLAFEGTAGDVVRIEADAGGDEMVFAVINPGFTQVIARPCSGCTEVDVWIQLAESGTHYAGVINDSGTISDGDTYTVTTTRTSVTPTNVALGDTASGDLSSADRAFFSVEAEGAAWLEYALSSLTNLSVADLRFYERGVAGELDGEVPAVDVTATSGDPFERIYGEASSDFLVAVADADGADGDESFDFTADDADFDDLGILDSTTDVDRTDEMLAADGKRQYLAFAEPGSLLQVEATGDGGVDVVLDELDSVAQSIGTTDDNAGGGSPESVDYVVPTRGWVAFRVTDAAGTEGTFDLTIVTQDPPYEVTRGEGSFSDICPSAGGTGVVHATVDDGGGFGADDDGISDTPLSPTGSFDFFGSAISEATISTNGWITFEESYSGTSVAASSGLPSPDAPNAVLAPYWTDLINMEVCVLEEASSLTVQWTGNEWFFGAGPPVQFQAIINADGTIEVIYGPDHEATGELLTTVVGVENADGSIGIGAELPVAAGESITFVPTTP